MQLKQTKSRIPIWVSKCKLMPHFIRQKKMDILTKHCILQVTAVEYGPPRTAVTYVGIGGRRKSYNCV
jgi:hypothetical protein